MSKKREPSDTHVQVLVSGIPVELLRWYDMEAYRINHGKKGGGRKIGSGRSAVILRAMEQYRSDRKRHARQNRERKAEKRGEAEA